MIYEEIFHKKGISILLNNIGNVHRNLAHFEKALTYYERSLKLKQEIGDQGGIASTLHNIGQIYFMQKKSSKMRIYCKRSLKIFKSIGDQHGIALNLTYIGKDLMNQGSYKGAYQKLIQSKRLAQKLKDRSLLIENLNAISDLYAHQKKYREAFFFLKEYSTLKEELFNNEKLEKVALLQARYEIEEKTQKAEIFQKENIALKKANLRLKQMYVQLDLISKTDPLTKVFNRRAIIEKIEEERIRFERNKRVFTVILGDIDHFKRFNDQYGHDCGDYVLISTASLIEDSIRKQDSTGRWGGEEFIILLPETDRYGGYHVAEKIRELIANNRLIYKGLQLGVTITFGVATISPNETIESLIKRSDNALYKGKRIGRNCSIVSDS